MVTIITTVALTIITIPISHQHHRPYPPVATKVLEKTDKKRCDEQPAPTTVHFIPPVSIEGSHLVCGQYRAQHRGQGISGWCDLGHNFCWRH